jgi:hypothetical protein
MFRWLFIEHFQFLYTDWNDDAYKTYCMIWLQHNTVSDKYASYKYGSGMDNGVTASSSENGSQWVPVLFLC